MVSWKVSDVTSVVEVLLVLGFFCVHVSWSIATELRARSTSVILELVAHWLWVVLTASQEVFIHLLVWINAVLSRVLLVLLRLLLELFSVLHLRVHLFDLATKVSHVLHLAELVLVVSHLIVVVSLVHTQC